MPNLTEALTAESSKSGAVDDCLALIDAEVSEKGGLSGLAIKAGYRTIQGIKPGFVRQVVTDLLPEFARALEPLYQEAKANGRTVREHFNANATRVADALLTITDDKAKLGPQLGADVSKTSALEIGQASSVAQAIGTGL